MKRVYPLATTVCLVATVLFSRIASAQCNCPGGGKQTQYITIDTSTATTSLLTFQQFYDPTGKKSLSCVLIEDTLTIVSSTLARNKAASPINNAKFTITVGYALSGPDGLSGGNSNDIKYGPYNFGPTGTTGTPSDSVIMGPDTMLNKATDSVYAPSVVPYIGTGTVSDTLTFGGGAYSASGTNYDYSIRTKYWGSARITYFWCPSTVLATTITDFNAIQQGNSILLSWLSNNIQNNISYEIQISSDGKSFNTIGKASNEPVTAGSTAKYQYQFNLNQAAVGKIWFRIRQVDASGQVSYSTVLVVAGGEGTEPDISLQTYPNPATSNLTVLFNRNLTGRFHVELVNTAGQVILTKNAALTGTSQIGLDLTPNPPKGLYFLRAIDQTHNQTYVSKVFVN